MGELRTCNDGAMSVSVAWSQSDSNLTPPDPPSYTLSYALVVGRAVISAGEILLLLLLVEPLGLAGGVEATYLPSVHRVFLESCPSQFPVPLCSGARIYIRHRKRDVSKDWRFLPVALCATGQ